MAFVQNEPFDYKNNILDNEEYIKGLLNNNHQILQAIYKNYAHRVQHHIVKNGGTVDDAKDVFQDALMIIYKNAQKDDFKLTSKFYTYLFGVCRFVFDRKMKKNRSKSMTNHDFDGYIYEKDLEKDLLMQEKVSFFQEKFCKLDNSCQKILELFFAKVSMEDIAIKLKLKNAHTTRNRKYRCQKKLEELIREDRRYREFYKK